MERGTSRMNESAHRKICGAVPIIALLSIPTFIALPQAHAQSAPSHDQCTCMIKPGQSPTGAKVVNAGSCTRHKLGDWCDIYLTSTENSSQHMSIIGRLRDAKAANSPDQITQLLMNEYGQYLEALKMGKSPLYARVSDYGPDLERKISDVSKNLSVCIEGFLKGSEAMQKGEGYFCRVGSQSGWLNITFSFGDGEFSYLFAPAG